MAVVQSNKNLGNGNESEVDPCSLDFLTDLLVKNVDVEIETTKIRFRHAIRVKERSKLRED